MMEWFKSVWMRMRKSNNLPGNEVLIPMNSLPSDTTVTIDLPQKPKRKYTRKKQNVTH
jgi:hypothetical protein